jgi:deoxyribodipyrimidine photo-lyase
MAANVIVWFRQDLRLADQAALATAVEEVSDGGGVLPVYVLDDESPGRWAVGGAQRWWLHHSLEALDRALRAKGARLILKRGHAPAVLAALARETGAARVHALHHYEPWWIEAEDALARETDLILHHGNQLVPPDRVRTGNGGRYRIYSPFQRALSMLMPPPGPVDAPERIPAPANWPDSAMLADWALLPTHPNWAEGFGEQWQPGEAAAQLRLLDLGDELGTYSDTRNLPSDEGTTRLSPHLHFGEISPAQVWHATDEDSAGAEAFRRELAWRDFSANIILQFPRYGDEHGRRAFDGMPWRRGGEADADLRAWQQGRTGYPIVDAGMRQLWATGWMHNRVRMIAASFLVKHLLIDWREGARWFWDTLVDADYGNNSVNWQWVAGSGMDASNFGRIMAPVLQSHKFEAGDYIRRWVPELSHLHDDVIHDPHAVDAAPADYPPKRIEHKAARARALAAAVHVRGLGDGYGG